MTSEDKKSAIQELVARKHQLDNMYGALEPYFGKNPDGKLWTMLWDTYQKWLDLVALSVGDKAHWISWFVFDNECGTHGLTAGFGDDEADMVPVTCVKELMPFILNKGRE